MRQLFLLFSFIVFMLVTAGVPSFAQTPANTIVIPGYSIGKITLGMSQQHVLLTLGMPNQISEDRSYEGPSVSNIYWEYREPCTIGDVDKKCLFVLSWTRRGEDAGGVDFLFTNSNKYRVAGDIGVGTTYQEIFARYGAPDDITSPGPNIGFWYPKLGIRFVFSNGKLLQMYVIPKK